jgi:monofunctional glycosyltransferase
MDPSGPKPSSPNEDTRSGRTGRTGPTHPVVRRDTPDRPWGDVTAPVRRRHRRWSWIGRWLRRIGFAAVLLLGVVLGLMLAFRYADPPFTPVIAAKRLAGEAIDQRWVPLERISPRLARAVVASEDALFCQHAGIDFGALRDAIEDTRRGSPRGGSTLTMQVVKNLFLWPHRSYVRKAIELPLALVLDFVWPKRRILEVYLNIAEWGPGIYGAEAAAHHAFGKTAARLTDAEAARLAVSLPNPAERDPGDPNATVERLAARLEARVRRGVSLACLQEP